MKTATFKVLFFVKRTKQLKGLVNFLLLKQHKLLINVVSIQHT